MTNGRFLFLATAAMLTSSLAMMMAAKAQAQPWNIISPHLQERYAERPLPAIGTKSSVVLTQDKEFAGARLWLVQEMGGGEESSGADGGGDAVIKRGFKGKRVSNINSFAQTPRKKGKRLVKMKKINPDGTVEWIYYDPDEVRRIVEEHRKKQRSKRAGQEAPAVQPEKKEKIRAESWVTKAYSRRKTSGRPVKKSYRRRAYNAKKTGKPARTSYTPPVGLVRQPTKETLPVARTPSMKDMVANIPTTTRGSAKRSGTATNKKGNTRTARAGTGKRKGAGTVAPPVATPPVAAPTVRSFNRNVEGNTACSRYVTVVVDGAPMRVKVNQPGGC